MRARLLIALILFASLSLVHAWAVSAQGPKSTATANKRPQVATITQVDPTTAPNDLDTTVVITGTEFQSGATVQLGSVMLSDVTVVVSSSITATVPWGMSPGVYDLGETNPGENPVTLTNAITVTQAIGTWVTGGLYGGLVLKLAINPITPTKLYAAVKDIGMFRSRDSGETWELVLPEIGVSVVDLMDPLNPSRIYANKSQQQGIFRSDDEGDTWTPIPIPGVTADQQVFIHPTIPGTIFSGLAGGSNPSDCSLGCGLYKSTDYGAHWVLWMNGILTGTVNTRVTAMAFDPSDSQKMYAGTRYGEVFSTDDGGMTWNDIGQPDNYIAQLAVNPSAPHDLWACGTPSGGGFNGYLSKWVGGTTWNTDPAFSSVSSLVIDPAHHDTLWAGTNDGVQKTIDDGANWTKLGATPEPTQFVRSFAVDPTNSQNIYQAGTTGIYKTMDNGSDWHYKNQGLTGVVAEFMDVDSTNPNTLYAGSVTNLTFKSTNGGHSWAPLNALSAHGPILVDPILPQRVYIAANSVVISTDGGENWVTKPLPKPTIYQAANYFVGPTSIRAHPTRSERLIIAATIADYSTPANLLAGVIYASTDHGETWNPVFFEDGLTFIKSIAFDPQNPDWVYVGAGRISGGNTGSIVLKSVDGGLTWDKGTVVVPALGGWIQAIAVDPISRAVFAANGGGLYKSTNGGAAWIWVPPPPENTPSPIDPLVFTSGGNPILYAGTADGLFRLVDGVTSWQRATGIMGNVHIYSVVPVSMGDRTILYVSTSGGLSSGGSVPAKFRVAGASNLVNAGVYRNTTVNHSLFLPMIFRK